MRVKAIVAIILVLLVDSIVFAQTHPTDPLEPWLTSRVRVSTVGPLIVAADAEPTTSSARPSAQNTVRGILVATDVDSITVRREGQQQTIRIPRSDIAKVEVGESRKGRAALVGAGVGALLGLVYAAIETDECEADSGQAWCGFAYVSVPPITAAVGALAALAFGSTRWTDVSLEAPESGVGVSSRGVHLVWTQAF